MAGEWIPVDVGLFEKPEILRLCINCNTSVENAVCRVLKLWGWFSMNSADGTAQMNPRLLTMVCGADEEFWQEVANVGWLEFSEDGQTATLPGWDDRFSRAAKARAKHAKDQSKYRQKQRSDKSVMNTDHEPITTGEERRGQDNSSSSPEKVKKEIIPDFLRAYNASKKTKAFTGRPFPELVEACSDPTWVDEAKKALKRLPACAYFKTAVTIHQIVKTGFVEKINAGAFDTVTTRHNFRGGEAAPNPPRVFDDDARERKELTLRKLELEQQVREAAP